MARRYFVDSLPQEGGTVLVGDPAHHLAVVLRVRPGDSMVLCDGKGNECDATVVRSGGGKVAIQASRSRHQEPHATVLHVAFAPPKWTRADWLLEHGTEVGIGVFWPLWTERTRPQGGRHDRWDKVIRAAAGQCDRAYLPLVKEVTEFAEFLRDPSLPTARFLADGDGPPAPATTTGDAVLLVGPEGGFTAGERAAAIAAGFTPIGLGPHVLRTETAALVGAAAILLATSRAAGTHPPRS
ncbi:MAG: RsmE family RNA methyltransferase [Planctomycetota bacterium]